MNSLSCKQRRQRNSQPILESLDSRIVLSTIHPTIGAEGGAGVAIMQLQKRHEKLVELRIERQEKAIEPTNCDWLDSRPGFWLITLPLPQRRLVSRSAPRHR